MAAPRLMILAIDPGTTRSAYVVYDPSQHVLLAHARMPNDRLLGGLRGELRSNSDWATLFKRPITLVVEMVACYGMAVGKDIFETVFWTGRFIEAWERRGFSTDRIKRPDVKLHLCGTARAKDPHVRQACIDRFGGDRVALGGIKCVKCKGKGWRGRGRPQCLACTGSGFEMIPGPLKNVAADEWSALAVALTYAGGLTDASG